MTSSVATFKQWQTEYEKELWLCCTTDGTRLIVRRHTVCNGFEANNQQQATGSLARRLLCSLGTRPSKNRKGGSGTSAGVEVYTAPGMKAHFRLAFD